MERKRGEDLRSTDIDALESGDIHHSWALSVKGWSDMERGADLGIGDSGAYYGGHTTSGSHK